MSFDNRIQKGLKCKDWRKPYSGAAAWTHQCRPGGSCTYCQKKRKFRGQKDLAGAEERERDNDGFFLDFEDYYKSKESDND